MRKDGERMKRMMLLLQKQVVEPLLYLELLSCRRNLEHLSTSFFGEKYSFLEGGRASSDEDGKVLHNDIFISVGKEKLGLIRSIHISSRYECLLLFSPELKRRAREVWIRVERKVGLNLPFSFRSDLTIIYLTVSFQWYCMYLCRTA